MTKRQIRNPNAPKPPRAEQKPDAPPTARPYPTTGGYRGAEAVGEVKVPTSASAPLAIAIVDYCPHCGKPAAAEPSPTLWESRDLPMLRRVLRVSRTGGQLGGLSADEEDSLDCLAEDCLIKAECLQFDNDRTNYIVGITPKGLRTLGEWPE